MGQNPGLIYDVLLQYFSDASSCLPLADFYATLPRPNENPVDYWLRINRAADLADEGLHRQGRQMESTGEEVARMFVKHCPDPELACIFKCKPIQEWSSRDVQMRIDYYQREMRASGRANGSVPLNSHNAAFHAMQPSPVPYSQPMPEQCHTQFPHSVPIPDHSPVCNPMPTQCHASCQSPCPPSAHVVAQNTQQSEERILTRMMGMLEQIMGNVQQRGSAPHGGRVQGGAREKACRVCGDSKHSTITHFMSE